MRSFPSASRRRWATAATAAALALGAVAIPLAQAEPGADLDERRDAVQSQIQRQQRDLEHTSRQATRAADALVASQRRLGEAQARLAGAREKLAAARERDARTRAALAAAEERLLVAEQALAAGQAAVVDQRGEVADSVVDVYEQGPVELRSLQALVNSDSLTDLQLTTETEQQLVRNQDSALVELQGVEEQLTLQRAEVAAAKRDAAAQRVAAAENLAAIRLLEEDAAREAASVRELVATNRTARQQALAARQRDRAALQRLEQREERIKQLILDRAARERRSYSGDTGGLLRMPVNGYVTSPYGYRTHPIYGYYALHNGTDFGAACGSPLFAASGGTVIERYYDEVYGNRLFLSIGNVNGANITVVYNHLSSFRSPVGARVARGDVVGAVGTTGWSTGCHLHFMVLRNGTPVDPMPYL